MVSEYAQGITEGNDMLKRTARKELCFFLLIISLGLVSCEKKTAQTDGTENAKIDQMPELEKNGPNCERPLS
jgi:hypothetical protein